MLTLPGELVRVILRISTRMPTALDVARVEDFDPPQALDVANKIAASMSTKLALVRVCKTFKDIVEEFLYESIAIFRAEQLFPAIRSLQALLASTGYKAFRGERCLRLDVALGHRSQKFGAASWKEQWPWVTQALANLLAACPNLRILVLHSPPPAISSYSSLPTSSTLWMQVACNLTKLRVFANSLTNIPETDLIQLMGTLKNLEMIHVQAVQTGMSMFPPLPPVRTARLFRADEISQCLVAFQSASWPITSSSSLSAPRLNSIHPGSQGANLLNSVELPQLKTLSIPERGSSAYFAAQFKWKHNITRLILNGDSTSDMWMILSNFPMVQEFRITGVIAHDLDIPSFHRLEILEVSRLPPVDALYLLQTIAAGKLPKLRELVLSEIYQSTIDQSLQDQVDEFAARGISLRAKA